MTDTTSHEARAAFEVAPGQRLEIYSNENLVIPFNPPAIDVDNKSRSCKVIVTAETGGLTIIGDWKEVDRQQLDPGESCTVNPPSSPQHRYRVMVANTCENSVASVVSKER